ncbi:MAG TPA: hypothetical protein VH021_24050 [Trebonia sp.]|nr:hypothetical protein [Trebonia sp.]
MIALDAADLVVIAGRTLGIGPDAALDQLDVTAALDALAEARPPGAKFAGRAAAATAGVGLVRALLRHRPFPRQAQQVAVAAGLQFLSLNGWRADLNPPATAAVVIEALASGRLAPGDAAAWLAPRLSRARRARRGTSAGRDSSAARGRSAAARPGRGLPVTLPPARVPAGRALVGALLAVAVTGVTLLAAACSRGPDLPAVPSGGVSAVRPPAGPQPAPADSAYAACMRSHGVAGFAYPAATDVAVPVIGIGLSSARFSAAEAACGR